MEVGGEGEEKGEKVERKRTRGERRGKSEGVGGRENRKKRIRWMGRKQSGVWGEK